MDRMGETDVTDVFNLIPTLQFGLDINLKFDGPFSFDASPALQLFTLFNIQLCHGWTIDPQDSTTFDTIVLGKNSYNHVMEALVAGDVANQKLKSNEPLSVSDKVTLEKVVETSLICSEFLQSSASQLTYHGLYSLTESLEPNSLNVLFRNNHFSVLFKRNKESSLLYTLVTDSGYQKESNVIWENLSTVEGILFL